jgi:hypothetical protein
MAKPRRSTTPSLRIRDFLALVHDGMTERLGPKLDGFDWRQRFGYLQYFRGDPAVHYEIWVQRKTERLEIGLHFEGADRDRNYNAAALLGERAAEIVAVIGPEYELEEWTAQWTRLHRSFHAPALTPELAAGAADRAAALIAAMEPIIEDLGLRGGPGR